MGAFGALPEAAREAVLERYEARYGRPARLYVERMADQWQSARMPISRIVLARLFELVPDALPGVERMALAACLWRRTTSASAATALIPRGAKAAEIDRAVRAHYAKRLTAHSIPDGLRRRFGWLDGADVRAQEQVLNALRGEEQRRLMDAATAQIGLLHGPLAVGHPVRQLVEIDGHRLELVDDAGADSVWIETRNSPPPRTGDGRALPPSGLGWFAVGAAAAVMLWWLVARL